VRFPSTAAEFREQPWTYYKETNSFKYFGGPSDDGAGVLAQTLSILFTDNGTNFEDLAERIIKTVRSASIIPAPNLASKRRTLSPPYNIRVDYQAL
jgi:hypothetical protein